MTENNSTLQQPRILYFSEPEGSSGEVITELIGDEFPELEMGDLNPPEGVLGALKEYHPQVVLLDFSSEAFDKFSKTVENSDHHFEVILIIDPESEDEVLPLIPEKAVDYVFRDRLKKLPILIEQMITEKKYDKRIKPSFNGKEGSNYSSKIKENQEKYRSVFENSADGILLTVTGGRILAANPAACRIFKMSNSELCSAEQTDVIDSEDPRLMPAIEEREKEGKVKTRLTLIRKGDEKFEGEVTSAIFKDANGEFRTSTIVRDISEKERAEKELRKSEENYRNLFQYNPLPSLIYDSDTLQILEVNEGLIQLYGYSREELLKMQIPDLRPEWNRAKFFEKIQKERIKDGVVVTGVVQHITKNEDLIKVDIQTHRLEFQKKNCRVAVLNNVTEKEAIFEELEEKKNKLAAAQSMAKLGYWELDLRRNKLLWSDQVYIIWEKDKTNFTPTQEFFVKSIHPDYRHLFAERMIEPQEGKVEHDVEYQILLENDTTKWIRAIGSLRFGKDGKPTSFGGTLQDITDQKEAQEKLRLNEARHRGILMSQTNYLIRTDLKGRYTYCNEKFQDDFGWINCEEDLLGLDGLSSVKPYHYQKVKEAFHYCLDNPNQICQVEIDKLHHKDQEKTTLWDMVCLTDEVGNPVEVQCVGIDITQRVQAEKSLLRSKARYEIISKATSDAVYDWDCRTGSMEWSDGFKKLFGHELESDIDFWANHLHPEDRKKIEQSLKDAIHGTADSWNGEYRFKTADGEFAIVAEQGTIIRNDQQVAERMVGAIKDITEKKRNEEKLKKKEANLEAAQEIAGLGYWEFDIQNCSIFWSEYTFKIWERQEEEGQPDLEETLAMVHWEDVEKYTQEFKETLESGEDHDLEHRIVTAEGRTKWIHQRGKTTFDREGQPLRMEGTVQDITERKTSDLKLLQLNKELKTYTEELIAANKGLEQFSYIVSHNLRSPVANITGLADLIRHGDYDGEVKEKFLAELYASVKRLDNVIIDLNSILQLKKKITEKKEFVRFEQIVKAIKGSIYDQISKEGVKIVTDFEEVSGLNTVMSYMHSIFYNLITNSIKYRQQNISPVVRITSQKYNDKVVLVFEDNGLGIDLSKKGDQVFGLYKRFHHHVEGKGIGLFMVKTQVETLGGNISIFSEPGKGTRFVLEFKN